MLKKLRKKGSAYLIALGVIGALTITGIMLSKMTTAGRWNTVLTSNEKRAEECAESATNLTFKVIKENMNDHNVFWKLFSKNAREALWNWFMYFRLPAPVADAYMDPLDFEGAQGQGVDVQLDLFNNALFKPLYEIGITYVYDSRSPENESPLAPMRSMCESMGGDVRVTCTGRIKKAFGILSEGKGYKVGGVDVPLRKVSGFLGKLFDNIKITNSDVNKAINTKNNTDPTSDNANDEKPSIDLIDFLPDDPLLGKGTFDVSKWTYIVYGVPVPIGPILQPILDAIVEKICKGLDLTIQGLARKVFGDKLQFGIDFDKINEKIEEAINKCLPSELRAFTGMLKWGITMEKQGVLEVETVVEYFPNGPTGKKIMKKLLAHREFRVADIQPIAPDYTFFVANSRLLYENEEVENPDNWEGDDQIDWNDGTGDIVIHNLPSFKAVMNFLKNLFTFDLKGLCNETQLLGLVRINGTKKMAIKLTMFPKFDFSFDFVRKIELPSLLLKHKKGETSCGGSHSDKHKVIPGIKSVTYAFWDEGKPCDWGYFGGGKPGGIGCYWIPVPPRFARTLLMGNFHVEFPMSLRVEGYLTKIYSHIKLLLVKIYIPPFPFFAGLDIPIPWFWAWAHEEPYGFCRYPAFDPEKEDEAAKAYDPNNENNLPANVYSPAQYLKKASYYYNTSYDFQKDIENRSIEYNGKKTFICDGVTFVNDNLWLSDMHVMGRGIIVSAANIHINGNITREDYDKNGIPTVFSIVARNGSILTGFSKREVAACIFADKGLEIPIGGGLKVHGNLCLNKVDRKAIAGSLDVYYESNHCRSSLLSMIRAISKYEPTRYHVTLSSKLSAFQFVKPN